MVSATAEPDLAPPDVAPDRWYRGDVEGLRAVAIVLVVAYHVGLPLAGGGVIGIDVFFVISGFLITARLLREADRRHRVGYIAFWAGRIRRLVPALALMIGTTLVLSYLILPRYDLDEIGREARAAALFVSNLLFADEVPEQLTASAESSPYLHTWAVSVVLQFAVVWSIFVGLVCWVRRRHVTRRIPDFRRKALLASLVVVVIGSFAMNLRLTADDSSSAIFGLSARAWEFAAGGLVAALVLPDWLARTRRRTALGAIGMVLLGAAFLVVDDAGYPGVWAALPVLGTMLVLAGGETWGGTSAQGRINRALSSGPLQALGRTSYSWYLWHWPAIVLLVVALDDDRVAVRAGAALLSLPVAAVLHRWFEEPARRSPVLTDSRFRTFGIGIAATVVVLATATIVEPDIPALAPVEDASASDLQAPEGASLAEQVEFAEAVAEERIASACPGVGAFETVTGDKYCVDGDPHGTTTILLVGDANIGPWRRPLGEIAEANDIRLLVRQHVGCPPYLIPVAPGDRGDQDIICERQQQGDLRLLDQLAPDAVIVATGADYGDSLRDEAGNEMTPEDQIQAWTDAAAAYLGIIDARGIGLGVIQDAPLLPSSPTACLVEAETSADCDVPRDEAFAATGAVLDAEAQVLDPLGASVLDTGELMCDDESCAVVSDGTLVFLDQHLVSDAFAMRQIPHLERLVSQLIS